MQFDDDSWFSMSETEYEESLRLDALAYSADLLATRYADLLAEIDFLSWAERAVTSHPQFYGDEERLALAARMLKAIQEYADLDRLWKVVEENKESHTYGH